MKVVHICRLRFSSVERQILEMNRNRSRAMYNLPKHYSINVAGIFLKLQNEDTENYFKIEHIYRRNQIHLLRVPLLSLLRRAVVVYISMYALHCQLDRDYKYRP